VSAAGNMSLFSDGDLSVGGNITSTGGAGTVVALDDGYYTAGAYNITVGGLLNITQDAAKDLTILTAGGNILSNAFFNQSLQFQNLQIRTKSNNAPISIGGNVTTQDLLLYTNGTSSGITISGNASATRNLVLYAPVSNINVTGNLDSTGTAGSSLSLVSIGNTGVTVGGTFTV